MALKMQLTHSIKRHFDHFMWKKFASCVSAFCRFFLFPCMPHLVITAIIIINWMEVDGRCAARCDYQDSVVFSYPDDHRCRQCIAQYLLLCLACRSPRRFGFVFCERFFFWQILKWYVRWTPVIWTTFVMSALQRPVQFDAARRLQIYHKKLVVGNEEEKEIQDEGKCLCR